MNAHGSVRTPQATRLRARLAAPLAASFGVALACGVVACEAGSDARSDPRSDAGNGEKKVMLIGIDGVRPDVLADVHTPHLDALAREGAFSARARTTFPSVSGPGWSSMLLGVWPEKHGVTSNDFRGHRYDEFPDFLTRIERERPELETFAVADWLPLVSDDSGGPALSDAIDTRIALDGYAMGWLEADERGTELAVEALRDGDPDALFVYLGNPDESSHEHGSIGREYREAIEAADGHVGRLLDAMRSRASFGEEDWLVLVSTDHGRLANGGHGGDTPEERTIFYLASGPASRVGEIEGEVHIVDVAVTALAHLGFAADPEWGLDGTVVGLRHGVSGSEP